MTAHPRFTESGGVKIRYLDNEAAGAALPILFAPGITDFAEDYLHMFDLVAERRLLVVEMRGRGGSDAPDHGYSAQAQAQDLASVVSAAGISRFHLMTFSRGTTPAILLACGDPDRIATLSIGDYRPVEIRLPDGFVEQQWATRWRGVPIPQRVQRKVLEGIQADSTDRSFWGEVAALGVPVLVARGERGGLVDDDDVQAYRQHVPGVEVVTMAGAGHDLFRPRRHAYPQAVLEFILRHGG